MMWKRLLGFAVLAAAAIAAFVVLDSDGFVLDRVATLVFIGVLAVIWNYVSLAIFTPEQAQPPAADPDQLHTPFATQAVADRNPQGQGLSGVSRSDALQSPQVDEPGDTSMSRLAVAEIDLRAATTTADSAGTDPLVVEDAWTQWARQVFDDSKQSI